MNISLKEIRKQSEVRNELWDKIGPINKLFAHLAIYFTKIALMTPITGNMISMLSILVVFIAAGFFAIGGFMYLNIGIFLLYFSEFLDHVDGLVARCKNQVTKLQCNFLCKISHHAVFAFVFAGIGIGIYRITGDILSLYLGFAATIFALFTAFLSLNKQVVILSNLNILKGKKVSKLFSDRSINEIGPSEIGINTKKQWFLLKLAVFPMVHLLEITLIAIITSYFLGYGVLSYYLYFYGIFLFLRVIPYFASSYFTLKRLEEH